MPTWREAVREELSALQHRTGRSRVTLEELLDQALPRLSRKFPENNHPEAKVRQQLQELRDRDELGFVDNQGTYEIYTLDAAHLDQSRVDQRVRDITGTDPAMLDDTIETITATMQSRNESAERIQRLVDELRRNERIITELKELYNDRCQVCGAHRRQTQTRGYAEGHHVRPLGVPHDGPDTRENLLIVCPNHHADFDYGMVTVEPQSHTITHAYDDEHYNELHVERDHTVGDQFLQYHERVISQL